VALIALGSASLTVLVVTAVLAAAGDDRQRVVRRPRQR
jgi:hypothetical protein